MTNFGGKASMFREGTVAFGTAADAGRPARCRFPHRACCGPELRRAGPGFQPTWLCRAGGRHKSARLPSAGSARRPELQFHIERGARSTIQHAAKHARKKRTGPQNVGPVVQYAVVGNGMISRGEHANADDMSGRTTAPRRPPEDYCCERFAPQRMRPHVSHAP